MSSTLAALQGRLGSFEFWLCVMHIGELTDRIKMPNELPGWDSLTLEERYQREVNEGRVRKDIAPYFAADPDRFSNALILAAMNSEKMQFEPLQGLRRSVLPGLYESSSSSMGFLTFSGSEVLVPLDGQHRALALKYALNGMDAKGKEIGFPANTELAAEAFPVVLIRFDEKKARRVFNKVNRYAKPTSRGQNLITDDDDQVAVTTRRVVGGEDCLLEAELVRVGSNTLSAKAPEFTTLSTLYDANTAIIKGRVDSAVDPKKASAEHRELHEEEVVDVWTTLIEGIEEFRQALADRTRAGDTRRMEIRRNSLLGKPVGQLTLVRAFLEIEERCRTLTASEICRRLDSLDWSIDHELWRGVLVRANGRVMSGATTVNQARLFVAHLCGSRLDGRERQALKSHIFGDDNGELPEPRW